MAGRQAWRQAGREAGRQSLSTPGGSATFKHVLECYAYNAFLSKSQESAYKAVYAVIRTDDKVSLMTNMTAREAETRCVIVLPTFTNSAVNTPAISASVQGRRYNVNWGGGCIFIYSCSARRVSFQIKFKLSI